VAKVTVLMPVYNAERYLKPAIDSILAQTYEDFEFLIINDGSADSSRKIVESYGDSRIKLVDNPSNMGLPRTLNRGLSLATGELIARQDADDVSHRERLSRQAEFLDAHTDVVLVGSRARIIDEAGRDTGLRLDCCCEYESIRWDLLFDNSFVHTAVMFRRAVIANELGGYDESFRYNEDYDLWSRVSYSHRVENLARVLVDYRVHPHARMSSQLRGVIMEENRRVVQRNVATILGMQALTRDDVCLIMKTRFEFQEGLVKPFLKLFKRILSVYLSHHPTIARSKDFRSAVARQYLRLAYRARRSNPYVVWCVLAESIVRYPVLQIALSWAGSVMTARAVRRLAVLGARSR